MNLRTLRPLANNFKTANQILKSLDLGQFLAAGTNVSQVEAVPLFPSLINNEFMGTGRLGITHESDSTIGCPLSPHVLSRSHAPGFEPTVFYLRFVILRNKT